MTETLNLKKKINSGYLNDLTGKEWLCFSKSWFVSKSAPRKEKKLHPASYPENLVERFLNFFSKKGDWVLDPFAGTGTTLVMSKILGRNSIGIELYDKYVTLTKRRLESLPKCDDVNSIIIKEDSRNIIKLLTDLKIPDINFCITSPPYWNQLLKHSDRNKIRKNNNLDYKYGDDFLDLGLIDDYQTFLLQQKYIFDDIYEVMSTNAYLIVITNNIYKNGRLWPLAFDTLRSLSETWVPKDEMIWCQNDKKLFPFGMFHTYIGNRSHHYCLIFRKED